MVRNDLDVEPATLLEGVALFFRDEGAPNGGVLLGPVVWAFEEDVVRKNVVVANGRHDRHLKVVGGIVIILIAVVLAKDIAEF